MIGKEKMMRRVTLIKKRGKRKLPTKWNKRKEKQGKR